MSDLRRTGAAEMLAAARERIERMEPDAAWAAASAGDAVIVDLRSSDERRERGVVPGSVHVPRSVLEWRAELTGEWRNPHLGGPEQRLLLLCAEGFSSSLAAATLVDLGRPRSGDVIGGFEAWVDAGLPVLVAPAAVDGALPGMGGADDGALPAEAPPDSID